MSNQVVESGSSNARCRDDGPFTVGGTHRAYKLVPSGGFLSVEQDIVKHILRLNLLYRLQTFYPLNRVVARPVTEGI